MYCESVRMLEVGEVCSWSSAAVQGGLVFERAIAPPASELDRPGPASEAQSADAFLSFPTGEEAKSTSLTALSTATQP